VKVAEILRSKGANVLTVERAVSLRSALERMAVSGVGALVVTGPDGSMVGIVSERDVVRALATSGAMALDAAVEDVMTREVITCTPDDKITELMVVMTRRRTRHLPVVDGPRLAGIVSIGDLVKARVNELEMESQILREAYARTH
jgi:CBS domain-containing protein